jgi:hypothetical protein
VALIFKDLRRQSKEAEVVYRRWRPGRAAPGFTSHGAIPCGGSITLLPLVATALSAREEEMRHKVNKILQRHAFRPLALLGEPLVIVVEVNRKLSAGKR